MEIRDLTPYGYPGYSIREDGWLINPRGRMIGGSANGQVKLPLASGDGSEWRLVSWLVATAFVPQPAGFIYVRYKDGNKDNLHYTNLEWWPTNSRITPKKAKILRMLNEGQDIQIIAQATNSTLTHVRNVARERLKELKLLESSNFKGFGNLNEI